MQNICGTSVGLIKSHGPSADGNEGLFQRSNKIEARKILAARVRDRQQESNDEEYRNIRKSLMGSASRGNKIRTCNYLNDRVVDHRTGAKTKIRPVIENGEFERLD